ncbi:MAG: archease [Brevinematia bacterium]
MFEFFDHPSDIGVRGIGKSYGEAFSEAAKGMMSIMADLTSFQNEFEISFEVKGLDKEFLFLNFLNRILFEHSFHKAIWIEIKVEDFSEGHLVVYLKGEKLKTTHRNGLKTEVKAATPCGLKVYQEGENFIAQCVLDI